jgi:serine/threonine protein kinase
MAVAERGTGTMPGMSLQPGEVFAGYTVERELGAGGMGSVYLVRHPRLPRHDALKLLRAELCDDPAFVGRFEREADTVAQLDHPNIVAVHDRGSQGGQLWISMRFIDGTNAEKALAEYDKGMPADRAVRIVSKVASALDYAHRHDLLHRDVKPANILLASGTDDDETERVFLSDFGVAKAIGGAADHVASLTSTGSFVATLDYASPEQIKGHRLDHRADIYALGCVLYTLLTGSVPYPGDSMAARVYGHLNTPPPRPTLRVPSLPRGLDDVVAQAMAKEPDDRYLSCRALAIAAQQALSTSAQLERRGRPDQGLPDHPDHRAVEATADPRPVHGASQPIAGALPQPIGASGTSSGTSPGGSVADGSPSSDAAARGDGRRRILLIAGAVGLVVAGVVAAFVVRAGLAGNATIDIASKTTAASPKTVGSTGLASTPSRDSSSAAPGPVPRLPHSTPLRSQILLETRSVDGSKYLYQIDANTGKVVGDPLTKGAPGPTRPPLPPRMPSIARSPALSPDRGSIIYAQASGSDSTLRTSAVDGTGDRPLFSKPIDDCVEYTRPAWNPVDQTELAMLCTTSDESIKLYRIGVNGKIREPITTDLFLLVDGIAYAPDGKTVAFSASDTPGTGGSIYIQPTDGGKSQRVTDGTTDADPMFSPDGTHIVFRRLRPDGKSSQIFLVNVDGTHPKPLTHGANMDQNPAFSPDGDRIVFNSNRPNAAGTRDTQSWIMRADGSELHQIHGPGTTDGAPAWGAR